MAEITDATLIAMARRLWGEGTVDIAVRDQGTGGITRINVLVSHAKGTPAGGTGWTPSEARAGAWKSLHMIARSRCQDALCKLDAARAEEARASAAYKAAQALAAEIGNLMPEEARDD